MCKRVGRSKVYCNSSKVLRRVSGTNKKTKKNAITFKPANIDSDPVAPIRCSSGGSMRTRKPAPDRLTATETAVGEMG
jgi:hypothetical protein